MRDLSDGLVEPLFKKRHPLDDRYRGKALQLLSLSGGLGIAALTRSMPCNHRNFRHNMVKEQDITLFRDMPATCSYAALCSHQFRRSDVARPATRLVRVMCSSSFRDTLKDALSSKIAPEIQASIMAEVSNLPAKDIKAELDAMGVMSDDCFEMKDFIDRLFQARLRDINLRPADAFRKRSTSVSNIASEANAIPGLEELINQFEAEEALKKANGTAQDPLPRSKTSVTPSMTKAAAEATSKKNEDDLQAAIKKAFSQDIEQGAFDEASDNDHSKADDLQQIRYMIGQGNTAQAASQSIKDNANADSQPSEKPTLQVIQAMRVKQIQAELISRNIPYQDCLEKEELVQRLFKARMKTWMMHI